MERRNGCEKKILCLKACENFSNRRGMRFLIFYFIFFYFNWPLPPRTSETKNDWKVSTSVFSEIKRDFTRFLSSHVLKFFQNSKLSSFFVVKMKKKIIIISRKKKNESLNFAKSNAHRKTNAGGSFETQNFMKVKGHQRLNVVNVALWLPNLVRRNPWCKFMMVMTIHEGQRSSEVKCGKLWTVLLPNLVNRIANASFK